MDEFLNISLPLLLYFQNEKSKNSDALQGPSKGEVNSYNLDA